MVNVEDYFEKEEKREEVSGIDVKTGYPEPVISYRLVHRRPNMSLEKSYYWVHAHMKYDWGYHPIIKIKDTFQASESSAFFGHTQQRLGAMQDKVSQFTAAIGKMFKEVFQFVRELRVIDERLEMYDGSKKGDKAAEISLKGLWIEMVEGGAKNTNSVYGLAREVGFATLPDLFFDAPPNLNEDDIHSYVEDLKFNRKVKEVLAKKLKIYMTWKKRTYKELKHRRVFMLKYFRQHWDIIHMYIAWIKPYLQHIHRLTLNQKSITEDPDLIAGFEGTLVEVELLGQRKKKGDYYDCLLVSFRFRTAPISEYNPQYTNYKHAHIGQMTMDVRGYAWTKQDIDNYMKMREKENMELLEVIDRSLVDVMNSVEDDVEKYLKEAGEQETLPVSERDFEESSKKLKNPFVASIHGLAEIFGSSGNSKSKDKKQKKKSQYDLSKDRNAAIADAKQRAWNVYKNYKKAFKLLSW